MMAKEMVDKVRHAVLLSAAWHGSAGTGSRWRAVRWRPAGSVPAWGGYGDVQAGQLQAERRGPAADGAV